MGFFFLRLFGTAHKVTCSVSSGYLKKHHQALFHPPLPLHKLHSVQRLGFGTNNKIFVQFDLPWWDADCEVIYFSWEDEVRRVVNDERCTFYRAYTLNQLHTLFSLSCFRFRMPWWTKCQMYIDPG